MISKSSFSRSSSMSTGSRRTKGHLSYVRHKITRGSTHHKDHDSSPPVVLGRRTGRGRTSPIHQDNIF